MSFGKILRDLRGDKTQEEIAQAVGITKSSWAMYEREERIPRDEVKIQIAKYFGKSVQDIFFRQIEH
ncbi:MAG: helix-turn-helix transcriptional regulator [Dysosmobacter sp.]|nr:helix-turn-helix transcriptional regulator [Dysosmobacter sp.]